MTLSGLILAAGTSSRMGAPKALLPFRGETFLDRLIATLGASCSPVIVVLGHDADRIQAGLARAGQALIVHNPDYRLGQLSSLQCGLRSVPDQASGFLFTPVDHPAVEHSTVTRLDGAFRDSRALLVIPRHNGRRGHPVCCSRDLIAEFLALPPDAQARQVIHCHRSRTLYIDVADPGILEDVDDPEAYLRLLGSTQFP